MNHFYESKHIKLVWHRLLLKHVERTHQIMKLKQRDCSVSLVFSNPRCASLAGLGRNPMKSILARNGSKY